MGHTRLVNLHVVFEICCRDPTNQHTTRSYSIMDFNKTHLAPESTIRSTAEEALGELTEPLSSSNAARDRFIVAVGQLEDRFEQDVAELDAEVASIPPSLAHLLKSKELKKKERSDQRSSRKRLGLVDDVVSIASSSRVSQRGPVSTAVGDEKSKLQARHFILGEMEKMRQYEAELRRKLESSMPDQERNETSSALLRLQIANADKLVDMITAYRPSLNPKKRSRGGSPTVEEILSEVRASRASKNTEGQ